MQNSPPNLGGEFIHYCLNVATTAVQFVLGLNPKIVAKDPVALTVADSFAARDVPVSCFMRV